MIDGRENLTDLRRQWLLVGALYLFGLLLGYWFMLQVWAPVDAARWLTMAAAVMVVQMAILWWALPHNRPSSESTLEPALGYANGMTLIRGLLACLMAGFLFGPQLTAALAWAPAILYMLERLIDFFDGYVARITGQETKLGEILDMEFDGLGILIAIALAVQYGKLPPWYMILGLTRPLFVGGIWLRHRLGKPVFDLPPSDHRRLIAGFWTGFVAVALWPSLSAQVTILAGIVFAVPLVFSFGRDWLVVSGTMDARSPRYRALRARSKRGLEGWGALAARLLAAGLAFTMIVRAAPQFVAWTRLLGGQTTAAPAPLVLALAAVGTTAALLLLLGIVGRPAALVLAGLAAYDIMATDLRWVDNAMLLACAVLVVHLGSGKYALWKPEERLLHRKLGTRET